MVIEWWCFIRLPGDYTHMPDHHETPKNLLLSPSSGRISWGSGFYFGEGKRHPNIDKGQDDHPKWQENLF